MGTKYGVTRNLTFERQLRKKFDKTPFTTKSAELVYESTRSKSGYSDNMNAKNYLAGAVGAGVIKRVIRGIYRF